ncbi:MAG TPA: hypothetical protein VEL68_17935, partial [Thermodesulfobacteriota bacterium]|nr:hypothetical protein [Thermodesulfobacteriota bacterium]
LKNKIRKTLREKASPRHVPAIVMEMPEAPYTLNMKKVESAVTNIIHGRPVLNRDALMNPDVLDYFEKILPELKKEEGRDCYFQGNPLRIFQGNHEEISKKPAFIQRSKGGEGFIE